jgi:tetratricopeptide (TPR) repeat protein
MKPLCFVLMPFGKKKDAAGTEIDFDTVYREMIAPAIKDAGLEPLRADHEVTGGIIHQAMFERLILCDYAVADLTTANANVFYELGVRHGIRPGTTVCCFSTGTNLPFDVRMQRAVPYDLTSDGVPKEPEKADGPIAAIARLLMAAKDGTPDSPVFALVRDMKPPEIKHLKTDTFRTQAEYDATMKDRLASARRLLAADAAKELDAIEADLVKAAGDLKLAPAGVVVDLFLSRRANLDWSGMIALCDKMHESLKRGVMIREQLALAYNRAKQPDKAQPILEELIATNGPSSESYGLLGRIHKDRWDAARKQGRAKEASGHLDAAIEAYRKGFDADPRDAYPGVNAVTLMEFLDDDLVRRKQSEMIPVVRYAVERKIASKAADYWDRATQLELAVLTDDRKGAEKCLGQALTLVREAWEPETTARNLSLIATHRKAAGKDAGWLDEIVRELQAKSDGMKAPGKGI